jgi:hypothetical protein
VLDALRAIWQLAAQVQACEGHPVARQLAQQVTGHLTLALELQLLQGCEGLEVKHLLARIPAWQAAAWRLPHLQEQHMGSNSKGGSTGLSASRRVLHDALTQGLGVGPPMLLTSGGFMRP